MTFRSSIIVPLTAVIVAAAWTPPAEQASAAVAAPAHTDAAAPAPPADTDAAAVPPAPSEPRYRVADPCARTVVPLRLCRKIREDLPLSGVRDVPVAPVAAGVSPVRP
jgi:hypothetical protein